MNDDLIMPNSTTLIGGSMYSEILIPHACFRYAINTATNTRKLQQLFTSNMNKKWIDVPEVFVDGDNNEI